MIIFPCCKINLGLNIVRKREDGYHDIETVFYPIPLCDALEIKKMGEDFPSDVNCDLKITGNEIAGDEKDNLVVKAYDLLSKDFPLPRIHAHLFKRIPSQAGLGGGSADAAFMIRLLDERFRLNMGNAEMEKYAARLGADCAFFINAEPAYAEGKGEILSPISSKEDCLYGYHVGIVKPDIAISTAEAYSSIVPSKPSKCCREIVKQPIDTWKKEMRNDFETPIFTNYPVLATIKEQLYDLGAVYAQMSGSGSALFGIFRSIPNNFDETFKDYFHALVKIQ